MPLFRVIRITAKSPKPTFECNPRYEKHFEDPLCIPHTVKELLSLSVTNGFSQLAERMPDLFIVIPKMLEVVMFLIYLECLPRQVQNALSLKRLTTFNALVENAIKLESPMVSPILAELTVKNACCP
jgi:hypothetical protein